MITNSVRHVCAFRAAAPVYDRYPDAHHLYACQNLVPLLPRLFLHSYLSLCEKSASEERRPQWGSPPHHSVRLRRRIIIYIFTQLHDIWNYTIRVVGDRERNNPADRCFMFRSKCICQAINYVAVTHLLQLHNSYGRVEMVEFSCGVECCCILSAAGQTLKRRMGGWGRRAGRRRRREAAPTIIS